MSWETVWTTSHPMAGANLYRRKAEIDLDIEIMLEEYEWEYKFTGGAIGYTSIKLKSYSLDALADDASHWLCNYGLSNSSEKEVLLKVWEQKIKENG